MSEINKDIDKYYTIAKPLRAEIKIKGSKFIASAASVNTKEDAIQFLNTIRAEFFDATHNCFAYRIGYDGMEFRAADDGEPNGSAGKPILFSIKKFDLSDIIVVVTRYFGGTKLGVGGLARAYSEATEAVLSICEKKVINRTTSVKVFCTYEDISMVKRLVDEFAVTFTENYADAIDFVVEVHLSKVETFVQKITSSTFGRAGAMVINNKNQVFFSE